jgi:hypothetical protein
LQSRGKRFTLLFCNHQEPPLQDRRHHKENRAHTKHNSDRECIDLQIKNQRTSKQTQNQRHSMFAVLCGAWVGGEGEGGSMEQKTTSKLQVGHAGDGYQ